MTTQKFLLTLIDKNLIKKILMMKILMVTKILLKKIKHRMCLVFVFEAFGVILGYS